MSQKGFHAYDVPKMCMHTTKLTAS